MLKKIPSEQLQVGMHIHDLNCGWMEHGFFRSSFRVRRETEIEKILEAGILEVYIDTDKGADVREGSSRSEVRARLEARIVEQTTHPQSAPPVRVSQREEVQAAQRIQVEASTVIHGMLMDVRMGKTVNVERAEPLVERITDSIFRNPGALTSLCRIKARDSYTFQHSVSVCTLLVSFCRALDMDRDTTLQAGMGGLLHDIGKMAVPDEVLNKPGRLTEDEFEVMKTHVPRGAEILAQTPGVTPTALQIASEHHERFDGTGYHHGLPGQQISRLGRMTAIVDVYDAITSNRVYHKGMEPSEALKKVFEWSSHHFDEELVQQFIQSLGIYPVGSLVRLESQHLAVVVDQNASSLLRPVVRIVFDAIRRRPVPQRDLDLANAESSEEILGYEEPESWPIDVARILAPSER